LRAERGPSSLITIHDVALVSDESEPNAARLGEGAAEIVHDWLEGDGVRLHLGTPVDRIEAASPSVTVIAGEHPITVDVVVMAVGVRPRSELGGLAGLDLDDGAIPVDPSMRTRQAGLLAAGDVCRAENLAAGRPLRVEHWGDALSGRRRPSEIALRAGRLLDRAPCRRHRADLTRFSPRHARLNRPRQQPSGASYR
jgi:NADPH-dependent 2,4-dienoyl-CoA reductase/sulfur reductase-like enzyme